MPDWKHVVQVFVPDDKDTELGRVATGYPVARNLILTAGHAVSRHKEPGADWDDACPVVEVQWRLTDESDKWEWKSATPIWWSKDDATDAALLRTDFPEGVADWVPLSADELPEESNWKGLGFPDCGRRDEFREDFPMGGALLGPQHNSRLDLEVTSGPSFEKGWKGASGSPVVVDGFVVGLVQSCLEDVGSQRLRGVPVARLTRISEFQKLIGFNPKLSKEMVRRRNKARKEIVEILRSSDVQPMLAAFADEFAVKVEPEAVAEELFGELASVCLAFVSVRSSVRDELRPTVRNLFEMILPQIYPMATVFELNREIGDSELTIISVPFGSPVGVAVALAAMEGGEISIESLGDHGKSARGYIDLASAKKSKNSTEKVTNALDGMRGPEEGRNAGCDREVKAILAALATDSEFGVTLSSWDCDTAIAQESPDRFAAVINDRLEALRQVSKRRFFFPYHQNAVGTDVSSDALEFIARSIPELVIVEITGEKSARKREMLIHECIKAFMEHTPEGMSK